MITSAARMASKSLLLGLYVCGSIPLSKREITSNESPVIFLTQSVIIPVVQRIIGFFSAFDSSGVPFDEHDATRSPRARRNGVKRILFKLILNNKSTERMAFRKKGYLCF